LAAAGIRDGGIERILSPSTLLVPISCTDFRVCYCAARVGMRCKGGDAGNNRYQPSAWPVPDH
jgi:hypothetical protein